MQKPFSKCRENSKGKLKNYNKFYTKTDEKHRKKLVKEQTKKKQSTDYENKNNYSLTKNTVVNEKSRSKKHFPKKDSCGDKYFCNGSKIKDNKKYEPNFLLVDKKNDTISGSWLGKLFKGRSDLRSKDTSGEWFFNRASYRKKKRDKAKWYFDWMMDREILRYRKLYLSL